MSLNLCWSPMLNSPSVRPGTSMPEACRYRDGSPFTTTAWRYCDYGRLECGGKNATVNSWRANYRGISTFLGNQVPTFRRDRLKRETRMMNNVGTLPCKGYAGEAPRVRYTGQSLGLLNLDDLGRLFWELSTRIERTPANQRNPRQLHSFTPFFISCSRYPDSRALSTNRSGPTT